MKRDTKLASQSSKCHFPSCTEVFLSEGHCPFQSQAGKTVEYLFELWVYGHKCFGGIWVVALPVNQTSLCQCSKSDNIVFFKYTYPNRSGLLLVFLCLEF